MKTQFSFEELRIDEDWDDREQECYSNIFQQYSDNHLNTDSLCFIVPIPQISLPDKAKATQMKLNITVNNYRPIYSLCWSKLIASKELEDFIDTICDQSLLEVSFVRIIRRSIESFSNNKFKIIPSKDLDIDLVTNIWKKLLSK